MSHLPPSERPQYQCGFCRVNMRRSRRDPHQYDLQGAQLARLQGTLAPPQGIFAAAEPFVNARYSRLEMLILCFIDEFFSGRGRSGRTRGPAAADPQLRSRVRAHRRRQACCEPLPASPLVLQCVDLWLRGGFTSSCLQPVLHEARQPPHQPAPCLALALLQPVLHQADQPAVQDRVQQIARGPGIERAQLCHGLPHQPSNDSAGEGGPGEVGARRRTRRLGSSRT